MDSNPTVSVLMVVRNGAAYLGAAIDSVIEQQYRDWELVIVDDGSTDEVPEILESYRGRDPRIVTARPEDRLGLPRARNHSLALSRGRYLAILDADDEAEPSRLAEQVEFLERHPEIGVLASWVTPIDPYGRPISSYPVVGRFTPEPMPSAIDWELCWGSPIYHSSVLMRREPVEAIGGYATDLPTGQDYDLWVRLRMLGVPFRMLPDRLTRYRKRFGQVTETAGDSYERRALGTASRFVEWLLGEPVDREALAGARNTFYQTVLGNRVPDPAASIELARRCLNRCAEGRGRQEVEALRRWVSTVVLDAVDRNSEGNWRLAAETLRQAMARGLIDPGDRRAWSRAGAIASRLPRRALRRVKYSPPVSSARKAARRGSHRAAVLGMERFRIPRLRQRFGRIRAESGRTVVAVDLTGLLGDLVACEPISRDLRRRHPDAHIVWIVQSRFRELVEAFPAVDEALEVSCFTERIPLARAGLFDELIVPYFPTSQCWICGIMDPGDREARGVGIHNYYDLGPLLPSYCRMAGIPELDEPPRLSIPEEAARRVDALELPDRFVAIHARSSDPARDWLPYRWTQLASAIDAELGLPVVEVGSLRTVIEARPGSYVDLCGKTSILETAEVIRRAELFIGIDSGPAHLASAVGVEGVILLGHFRTFTRYVPYCGPYADGSKATLIHHDGPAETIPVEEVLRRIRDRVGGSRRAGVGPGVA